MSDIERAMNLLREERAARRRARRTAAERFARAAPDVRASDGRGGRFDDETFTDIGAGTGTDSDVADSGDIVSPGGAPVRHPSRFERASMPERASAGESGFGHRRTPDPRHRTAPKAFGRSIRLPLEQLGKKGFVTPALRQGRLSEQFRRVKRPILKSLAEAGDERSTDGGPRNIIMVTSSVSGEGKTYTAINLAMSLAMERERTVLLVDADVFKGTAGRTLGVEPDCPGLTDLLADDGSDLSDVILGTDVPDLRFVPAGTRSDETTELLSSTRMRALIDELADRYADRIVVLDCPPMLQTNEANVIAEYAGQVVFVVAGEETSQRLVLEAMGRFDDHCPVGVLLNKARNGSAVYGYDYVYD